MDQQEAQRRYHFWNQQVQILVQERAETTLIEEVAILAERFRILAGL